jgi:4-amino-4-deoxy-L-arabinose transferase-like glycosyltransferase
MNFFEPQAESERSQKVSKLFIALSMASCLLQVLWFASKCWKQINFDGMAYVGIARHLREGKFHIALNAFRSPLISWLIAAASFVNSNYLLIGKVVSVGSLLFCMALLYLFTVKLWHSKLVASLAVLLFTLERGIALEAVATVNPDFLFTALTLGYFIALLECIRTDRLNNWFALGCVHAVAFLAKAFALPWLALCTIVAIMLLRHGTWKSRSARLVVAALVPAVFAGSWAVALHSKYGAYTTGSQFKANLLQWTLRAYQEHREPRYALLRDTSKEMDEYAVNDPMPPESWAWSYRIATLAALPKVVSTERHNLPAAAKELIIVLTPGMVMAFVVMLVILTKRRLAYPIEWRMAMLIAFSGVSLILAYCMMVFDGRYLLPFLPLALAVGTRFLVADPRLNYKGWRKASILLVVLGAVASLVYPSSPFRVLTRDFQIPSYAAGKILRMHSAETSLVSIGSGPFPEHGVGWEAGYQAAYFGSARLIATLESLPDSAELPTVVADIERASPDAVAVWGKPDNVQYMALVGALAAQYRNRSIEKIDDPVLGEVGTILFADGMQHLTGTSIPFHALPRNHFRF